MVLGLASLACCNRDRCFGAVPAALPGDGGALRLSWNVKGRRQRSIHGERGS